MVHSIYVLSTGRPSPPRWSRRARRPAAARSSAPYAALLARNLAVRDQPIDDRRIGADRRSWPRPKA